MQTVGTVQYFGSLVTLYFFLMQGHLVEAGENTARMLNSSVSSETRPLAGQSSSYFDT